MERTTSCARVRGTRRRAVGMFLAIARNRRASGFQPYLTAAAARTAEKVPALEGLLHQIEVRIDPAFAQNHFRPAVTIDRKGEVTVSAFENVIASALRRQ
jgi:hypothetical protein